VSPVEHLSPEAGPHTMTWRPGSTCAPCQEHLAQVRASKYNVPPLTGVVPGGSKDTAEFRGHMDFDKGLYAYADARAEGLQPDSTTLKGVAKAHSRVKSQEAALRDASKFGFEFGPGIQTAPGVDREKYVK